MSMKEELMVLGRGEILGLDIIRNSGHRSEFEYECKTECVLYSLSIDKLKILLKDYDSMYLFFVKILEKKNKVNESLL